MYSVVLFSGTKHLGPVTVQRFALSPNAVLTALAQASRAMVEMTSATGETAIEGMILLRAFGG
jgi:hypothetical protein